MLVDVTQRSRGDFIATIFSLPDGRVIVTDTTGESAHLFDSVEAWERATGPGDALEEHESVTHAFLDVLPEPAPL